MAHWNEVADDFSRYCVYPDMGLNSDEARPYLVLVGGRLLHYFPRENRARTVFERVVAEMRAGHYDEAARHAGAFAHVIEDLSQPQCHAMEGVNGFSWTVLDELFTPEDQTWNRAPQSIITLDDNAGFQVELKDYAPQLLGTHPAEAAFRLYVRCCRLRQIARKALPPMLTAVYAGDADRAMQAGVPPAVASAKAVADMFHTCFVMAAGNIGADAKAPLKSLDLTDLVPIAAPSLISIPYRFSPLAYGCSVNMKREPVPLQLWIADADGEKRIETFERGIGTGCCRFSYELPPGVFSEFRCTAGLHAVLGAARPGANLRLTVRFAGEDVFSAGPLAADSPAHSVVVPVSAGGTLELISEGNPGLSNNEANHAVWADPVLVRCEAEPDARGAADSANTELGPNLLQNGGFEEWGANGLPISWRVHLKKDTGSRVDRNRENVHSGETAASLFVDKKGSIAALWTTFKNVPGKRYRLTFFWQSPVGIIQFAIKTHDDKGQWIAFNGKSWQDRNANPIDIGAANTWNQTVVEFPAYGQPIDMSIEICRPYGKGENYSIQVDDVTVQEIMTAP
jgi:hypothetical protein